MRKRTLPTTVPGRKNLKAYRDEIRAYDPNYFHKVSLRHLYKLDYSEWEKMLNEQDGVCKLCGNANQGGKRLSVDHEHSTGRVRGLLCTKCNISLGRHEREWFTKAVNYLKEE